MTVSKQNVTELLAQARGGQQEKLDQLMQLLYDELRRMAACYSRRERTGQTATYGSSERGLSSACPAR